MLKNRKKNKELKNKLAETKELEVLQTAQKINKIEIKAIKKANKTPKGTKLLKNNISNVVDVFNVNKTYVSGTLKYNALKNVSFSIKKRDFVVILGPSGSGKTTLLNVLSGLDRPTSGEVIVNGVNIAALSNRELTTFRRNNIGFIFQSYNLLLELNAIDNAEMGRQLQIDNNRRLDVKQLFNKVGLANKKKSLITELSGGELQRVSIVRALSKNPEIIFADEPTGALDSKTSAKIIQLFQEINRKYKTTIIIVTHDEAIANIANRIIEVKDGIINVKTK